MTHIAGVPSFGSSLGRTTGTLSRNSIIGNLQQAQSTILLLSEQLSSGIRIVRPSIDPIGTNLSLDLQNRLNRNDQYARNADDALGSLSTAEAGIGQTTDLMDRAHDLALQQLNDPNATTETRRAVAAEIDQLLQESVNIANQSFHGKFLFAGSRTNLQPFSVTSKTVAYGGDAVEPEIAISDSARSTQSISGARAFGAISAEMIAQADLDPDLTAATKLSVLNGGAGITPGDVVIGDGVTNVTVDLRAAEDVADLIAKVNNDMAAAGLDITIAINGPPNVPPDADRFVLTRTGGGPLVVSDLNGGRTAADLGIVTPGIVVVPPAPTGFVGTDVNPRVTGDTTLASLLPGGLPLDLSGITIVNSADVPPPAPTPISFAGLTTVNELLFAINGSGTNVTAEINAAGTAIDVKSKLSGARMVIGENGGTTAAQMGILYTFSRAALNDLNGGLGVPDLPNSADFRITFAGGTKFDIDISGVRTVAELEPLIEGVTGGAVDVTIDNVLGAIDMTGAGAFAGVAFTVTDLNLSGTSAELGITATAPTVAVAGAPRTFVGVQAESVFTTLIRLREGLLANDSARIQSAARLVEQVRNTVEDNRAELGGRTRRIDALKERLDGESTETQALLTNTIGTDLAGAATQFQLEQSVLQAGLQASARILNVSLLDFLR